MAPKSQNFVSACLLRGLDLKLLIGLVKSIDVQITTSTPTGPADVTKPGTDS